MPEAERLRLEAILERIALIETWIEGRGESEFLADPMRRDAVAMSLLVIGETARRVEPATRSRAPEVPWAAVISLRNRIAHGYETVDHRLVWQIVQLDLQPLGGAINRLLREP